jgi:membrane-bound lytic murein transglycosylase F
MVLPLLLSCSKQPEPAPKPTKPASISDAKIIRFITFNSPNTYFLNERNEYVGLEYELAKSFVAYLGKEYQLKLIVVDNFSDVLPALLTHKADIAAADISITQERKKLYDFSTPIQQVQQQIIYNRNTNSRPVKLQALADKNIVIPTGTSFVERLKEVSQKVEGIHWEERENTNVENLVEALAQEEIDYTIVDSHLLSLMQYYYPQIGAGISLGNPDQIAWAFAKNVKPELQTKVNQFFKKIKANGTLRNLIDRYHGNTKRLNPLDVKTFLSRSQTLLPKYERLFKHAQDVTDVDWRLIAAISYQESHWDTYNTSPTNVRGLMMLTEDTSDMMNVTDRLDPNQSIKAGAKFFLWIKERFPERIPEPDRTFMALASYNIGFGHVEDARILAQRTKLNPDSWADVKQSLIKLRDAKYYTKAKYGYCSCGAPVIYTESIRSYYQIMQKNFPSHNPDADPFKIAMMN